jgi:hypothetical protein
MPGRAIIVVLLGVIIITGLILSGIFRFNNSMQKNMVTDYQRKAAYNIAQSGANLGLRQLKDNPSYRSSGYPLIDMMDGKVSIRIVDTLVDSLTYVAVKSTGFINFGTSDQINYTSIAIPPGSMPGFIKAGYTTNSIVSLNGNAVVDGRNHNIDGSLAPPGGTGTVGIWSTSTVNIGGSAIVGGTVSGIDYAPDKPPYPGVFLENQVYPGGYPNTPDQVLGGAASGFPEGTLKKIAQSGIGGSAYIPVNTTYLPSVFSGVTFIDLNSKNQNLNMTGSGILVFNNVSITPLSVKLLNGGFTGIVILANNINIDKLHGEIIGALVTTGTNPTGNVALNSNGTILYSSQAILNAIKKISAGNIVWFER